MLMKKVVVSAPGKLHLSGEHAVVYGKPAVLVATSRRLYVTLEAHSQQPTVYSKSKIKNDIEKIKNKDDYLSKIIRLVGKKYSATIKDCTLAITSDIPIGAGMGSSAALAVATIGALTEWLGKPWNPTEINELAFEAEKIQHGKPSGGDNTISAFGGILWYRKEFEFLKSFWLLPFKIPRSFPSFVTINTGRTESTKELVVGVVGEKKRKLGQEFTTWLDTVEKVTKQLVQAIHDENERAFCESMQMNEKLLEEIGVVSDSTRKLVREIEKMGGTVKISGAGGVKTGSGMLICLHPHPQALLELARKKGLETFQVSIGGEGVRREEVIV